MLAVIAASIPQWLGGIRYVFQLFGMLFDSIYLEKALQILVNVLALLSVTWQQLCIVIANFDQIYPPNILIFFIYV